MKDMKRVKIYFKKLIYSELIGIIREKIGKDNWNNNVHTRCCGMEASDDIDVDIVTGITIIEASKQGMFDDFDYEMKTEIVEYIMNEFKDLMYKTFHEICIGYRDINVRCDVYEFMRMKAARMKMNYTHHNIDDMRYELIRDTKMRFKHDLMMDCQRSETLEEYIEDVAVSIFSMRREADLYE